MRKSTKLAVILAVAALLVAGFAVTAFAGWKLEGQNWTYTDSNGDLIYNEFKKSSDGNYYYLGDEGYMLTNSLVYYDGYTYWVDETGKRVSSTWVAVPADDADADWDVDHRWYYFQSNGKAYVGDGYTTKVIGGKRYAFDGEGKMQFGLVDASGSMVSEEDIKTAKYWFGSNDDGSCQTNWYNYVGESLDNTDNESFWFYFNGKSGKVADCDKKLGGLWYTFDADGIMVTGWNTASESTTATYHQYFGGADDGHRVKKAWIYTYAKGEAEDEGNDPAWFYAGSDGLYYENKVAKINGKYYGFQSNGKMVSGLAVVGATAGEELSDLVARTTELQVDAFTSAEKDGKSAYLKAAAGKNKPIYFFSADGVNDGSLKTGSFKVTLGDDEVTMGFAKNGQAYNGYNATNKKVYNYGVLMTAGDDRYTVVENTAFSNETGERKWYVVGTSGSILRNGGVGKTADGAVYAVSANENADRYIAFFYETDYATSAAQAWAKGESKFKYGGNEYEVSAYIRKTWSNTTE